MPELPEVETIVRHLRRRLPGRRVAAVWWSGKRLRGQKAVDVAAVKAAVLGRSFAAPVRRGKYIILPVANGDSDSRDPPVVAIHLGMSGSLLVEPSTSPRPLHTHFVWSLGVEELRFIDPRRFGWVGAAPCLSSLRAIAELGADPLHELQAEQLAEILASSRAPVKSLLLDQRRIAGIGNIYASEALFRARIHPTRRADLVAPQAARLLDGIRDALTIAISRRGTTLRDFVDPSGRHGNNAQALLVYGRAGQPCVRCRNQIRRQVDAGRSTFFCPHCQR